MHRSAIKIGILAVAVLMIAACSGGGGASGPGDSVEQFFTALNDGDYSTARGMYDTEASATVNDPDFTPEGAYREWAEMITKKGSIQQVKVLGTEETEAAVKVSYELVYGDGTNRSGDVTVTQEDGTYRLGLVN